MSTESMWLSREMDRAPMVLRQRVEAMYDTATGPELPARLAGAADLALDSAQRLSASRDGALDLLAADALITLALLAVADSSPAQLGEFAAMLRRSRAIA